MYINFCINKYIIYSIYTHILYKVYIHTVYNINKCKSMKYNFVREIEIMEKKKQKQKKLRI